MKKQILFCVETNQNSDTDWVYIDETLRHYYPRKNEISTKPVYMDGKNKYRTSGVVKEIARKTKMFNGITEVILCIDTDTKDVNPVQQKYFNEVKQYCIEHNYRFIWFNRDVEEVYWKKHVSDKDKVQYAKKFRSQEKIKRCKDVDLKDSNCNRYKSNILTVLDEVLL